MHPRMEELLRKAETWKEPIQMLEHLNAEERTLAQAARFALGNVLKGRSLLDLDMLDPTNGFECWRILVQRIRPVIETPAMKIQLAHRTQSWSAFPFELKVGTHMADIGYPTCLR